jgi:hypothetical protein
VNGVEVKGRGNLLAQIIQHRKGWGLKGETDEKTIRAVAMDWVHHVGSPSAALIESWDDSVLTNAKIPPGVHPKFSPLTVEILTYDPSKEPQTQEAEVSMVSGEKPKKEYPAEKVVSVSYWTKKKVGMGPWRGPPFVDVYSRARHMFRVADGTNVKDRNPLSFEVAVH